MKKIGVICLSVCMLLSSNVLVYASENVTKTYDVHAEVVLEIPNDTIIGVLNKEDVQKLGPESFCVSNENSFFIGDTLNNRILEVTGNECNIEYELGSSDKLIDIRYIQDTDELYILSENVLSHETSVEIVNDTLQRSNRNSSKVVLENREYNPISLKQSNGEVDVLYLDDYTEGINAEGNISKCSNELVANTYLTENGFVFVDTEGNNYFREYNFTPVCTEYLGHYAECDYFYISEISFLETGSTYERAVVIIGEDNDIKIAKLENMDFFVPQNHICVSNEGKIYQMLVLAEKTQILELLVCEDDGLIKNVDNGSDYTLLSECVSNISTMQQRSFSDSVLASRCEAMKSYTWQYYHTINGNHGSDATKPSYIPNYSATVTGIPYCWGAAQAPTSLSVSANQTLDYQLPFDTAISSRYSYAAGNINTEGTSYVSKTAGVDCSGFVCIVFDVWKANNTRYGTEALVGDSGPFECVSGAPNYMELYIKSGSHVMIANGTISYSVGHGILPVYDSSVSEGRVTSRTIDLNNLESGYQRAILK